MIGFVDDYRKNIRAILRSSLDFSEKTTLLIRLNHQLELLCNSFHAGLSSFSFYQEENEGIQKLYRETKELLTRMGVCIS